MSHITREFEDWEEYDKIPAKKFEWGDEKAETTPTENEYYKQRLKELWLYWLDQSALVNKHKEKYPQDISAYFAGKAEGFAMAYLLLSGFDLNEDKR